MVFGAGVGLGTLFTPFPLPEDKMSYVKQPDALGRRVTVLWFTEGDVRDSWEAGFSGAVEQADEVRGRQGANSSRRSSRRSRAPTRTSTQLR